MRVTLLEHNKTICDPCTNTSQREQGWRSSCLQRREPVGSPASQLTGQQSEPASKPRCATLIRCLSEGAFEADPLQKASKHLKIRCGKRASPFLWRDKLTKASYSALLDQLDYHSFLLDTGINLWFQKPVKSCNNISPEALANHFFIYTSAHFFSNELRPDNEIQEEGKQGADISRVTPWLPLLLPASDPAEAQHRAGRAVPRAEQQHRSKGSGRRPTWPAAVAWMASRDAATCGRAILSSLV